MHCFWWDKCVELKLGESGGYSAVNSTREAVDFLLQRWPRQEGRAFAAAKRTCFQALEGKVKVDKARKAFIKAAQEAAISIRSQ